MLDAAVAVFSRRGYHAAGVDEIAEAAGISKPMVYAYLGTKEELFVACLRREATRLLQAVLDASAGEAGASAGEAGASAGEAGVLAEEQLRRGLRAFFGFVGAHRDGWRVLCCPWRRACPAGPAPFRGRPAGVVRTPARRRAARPPAARPAGHRAHRLDWTS